MDVLAIVVGLALVAWILFDSFETLLATSLRRSRWSFTERYYRLAWVLTRRVCVRITDDDRRERRLARFGPASFIGLLLAWTAIEILGWGLVWWGFRDSFGAPLGGFSDAWYFSGVVYFTIGFGDIVPSTGGLRFLVVLEGLSGLGTLGLLTGYLPSLNAAYSARERQLLLLDDLTDERITPVSLAASQLRADGDLSALEAMFDEWATWCAEIYDSHTSFPMLVFFRSKHRGHSWITGLGVVTDAAIAYVSAVPGGDKGSALRLHRQAVRLVAGLADQVGLPPKRVDDLGERWWSVGYRILGSTGLELVPFDVSYRTLVGLRAAFHPHMEAFIDLLLAPRGFWGPTAADHLAEADTAGWFPDEDPAGGT